MSPSPEVETMSDTDETERTADHPFRESVYDVVREAVISGLAVVVPVVITVLVIQFVLNTVYGYLDVLSDVLPEEMVIPIIPGIVNVGPETLVELLIPVVLFVVVLWVGLLVNSSRYGERAVDYFDFVITQIPGVGSVYDSFRQMSDVMLDSDAQNFRDVKLVEFPHEGAYTIGFVTTETPEALRAPTGHDEMLTLFLPLAPNPVMGGHLVHLPRSRVMDVDMSVEEGIRAVVTSGVAVADPGDATSDLSASDLRELTGAARAEQRLGPEAPSPDVGRDDPVPTDRAERYDGDVSPGHADTPADIVRRERDDAGGDPTPPPRRPERRADRAASERAETEGRPADRADRDPSEREETVRPPAERTAEADGDADPHPTRSDVDADDGRESGGGGRESDDGEHSERGNDR